MFNIGGGEVLVILLVALIVLGPTKLPDAARQFGSVMRELRKISTGFQNELKAAMDDPIEAASRERGAALVAKEREEAAKKANNAENAAATGSGTADPGVSTAEAAGMYSVPAADPDGPVYGPDDRVNGADAPTSAEGTTNSTDTARPADSGEPPAQ